MEDLILGNDSICGISTAIQTDLGHYTLNVFCMGFRVLRFWSQVLYACLGCIKQKLPQNLKTLQNMKKHVVCNGP